MSIPVDPTELARVLERFDYAYLTTVDGEGRAHVVAVSPRAGDGCLTVADLGRRSMANATARPHVTMLWPPGPTGPDAGRGLRERLRRDGAPALRCTTAEGWQRRPQ